MVADIKPTISRAADIGLCRSFDDVGEHEQGWALDVEGRIVDILSAVMSIHADDREANRLIIRESKVDKMLAFVLAAVEADLDSAIPQGVNVTVLAMKLSAIV